MGDGNTTPADAVTASEPFFIPARERRQTYDANPATAGQADHLTSDGIFTYEWDADGARPRGDGTTLSCPKDESGRVPSGRALSQDRLVTIEHTTSQPKFRKKFRYDYMSRRVEERYYLKDANDNWEVDPDEARKRGDGAPEACPKGRAGRVPFGRTKRQYARRYIYDGYTMVAELDVSDGATGQEITTRRTFAWGHENAGGGIGALLLVEDHPNDRAYYPGYDGRGSVTLLVDADTGEKVAGMDVARQRGDGQASLARRAKATGCPLGGGLRQYDVWGKLVRATGEWRATPFLYDTKWSLDQGAEGAYSHWPIGLYDYGFRFYQPATGRFISRDPVREEGGLNLYQAFAGDPVNRTDFLGLEDSGFLPDLPTTHAWEEYIRYPLGSGCYEVTVIWWQSYLGGSIATAMYNYYECLPSDGGGADTPNPGDGPGDGSGGGGGGDDPGEVDPRTREMMRERCQRYADNIERDLGYISSASGEHALFSLMRGYLVDNEGFSLSRDGANLVQKSVSTTLGLLGLSGIDGVSAASYGWNAGDILLQFERENYREGLEKLYNTGLKTYLGAVQKRIFRSIGSRPIPGVNLVGGAVDLHGLTMDIHEIKNAKRHTDIALASKLDHIEGGIRDAHASAETWKHRYSQENCDKWLRDE